MSIRNPQMLGRKIDNTAVNKRDESAGAATADQQKMNATDPNIHRKDPRSIRPTSQLSTYAHNVEIINQAGTVTLKEPFGSDDEVKSIVSEATGITGGPTKSSTRCRSSQRKSLKRSESLIVIKMVGRDKIMANKKTAVFGICTTRRFALNLPMPKPIPLPCEDRRALETLVADAVSEVYRAKSMHLVGTSDAADALTRVLQVESNVERVLRTHVAKHGCKKI